MLSKLSRLDGVLVAEPDQTVQLSSLPNDTFFDTQWAHHNTGIYSYYIDSLPILRNANTDIDLNIPEAWDIFPEKAKTKSVVVAIIDTGVDIRHVDLQEHIWNNPAEIPDNGIDDDHNGYTDDVHGWDFYHNDNTICHYFENADGSYVTFNFNGQQMPVIADATYAELWEKASGNYTNYARMYLGSTLSFMKSQAFEYQCTHEVGKEGAGYISTAIGLGTIKHPELAITENPWYTSIPTVLPTTKAENDIVKKYTNLTQMFSTSKGDDQVSILVNMIASGYAGAGDAAIKDAASAADTVANAWSGASYLDIKQGAWENLQDYYKSLN